MCESDGAAAESRPDELADTLRLAMISGVGPRIRQGLLERFGSARAVLSAAPSELREVQGVDEAEVEIAALDAKHDWTEGTKSQKPAEEGEATFLAAQHELKPWATAKGKKTLEEVEDAGPQDGGEKEEITRCPHDRKGLIDHLEHRVHTSV